MRFTLWILLFSIVVVSRAAGEEYDYYDYDYEEEEEFRIVEAPWEYINRRDRVVKKKSIGPAGWVCSRYNIEEPWHAYDVLEEYLRGANELGLKFQQVTWPMVKSMPQEDDLQGYVCHYMEKEYHCTLPTPVSGEIMLFFKQPKLIYWSNEFWGQASDNRVRYTINVKLMRSFRRKNLLDKLDMSVAYLSYWPDNKKEVSFNLLDQTPEGEFLV